MNFNLNSMDVDIDNQLLFIGTTEGDICVYSIVKHSVIFTIRNLHWGIIESINVCSSRNYVATLGGDRFINILKYDKSGELNLIFRHSIRDLGFDDFLPIHSPSQAIFLHPKKDIVSTRSGNSCLVQIGFPEGLVSSFRAVEEDLITVRYSDDGEYILAGANTGEVGVITNAGQKKICHFDNVNETIHWFEPIAKNSYMVATDVRRLLKIELEFSDNDIKVGHQLSDIFSDDDFEHITKHLITNRCVATSFDRRIYEINVDTLSVDKILFNAPFKIRWAKFYDKTDDSKLVIQVRDGSLLFIDLDKSLLIKSFKKTNRAIWTSAIFQGGIICAGENGFLWHIDEDNLKSTYLYDIDIGSAYVKRVFAYKNVLYIGCTDGSIYCHTNHVNNFVVNVASAVRDICVSDIGDLYIASESGNVFCYSKGKLFVVYKSIEPIWSISIPPDNSKIVFGERKGNIVIYDLTKNLIIDSSYSRVPKRIKWIDNNRFLATHSSRLDLFAFYENSWHHHESHIDPASNTIEDYVILDRGYIAMITYSRRVFLADIDTGEILDSVYNGSETMKSIIQSPSNKSEFMIFGRDEKIKKYCIHNEQLLVTDFGTF